MRHVKLIVLFLVAFSFAATLRAGSETALTPPPSVNRAAFNQDSPAIASDGTNFLVAWTDERGTTLGPSIFATRLGPDGKILDAAPLQLRRGNEAALAFVDAPRVVWTGSVYLVGWSEYRWDSSSNKPLVYVTIDRNGHVVGPERSIPLIETAWSLAAGGGRVLLLFTNTFTETLGFGQLLDAEGEPVGTRFPLPHAGSDIDLSAASNGHSFYAVWTHAALQSRQSVGAPISLGGVVGPERDLGIDTLGGAVRVASNGSTYLVAYQNSAATLVTEEVAESGAVIQRIVHADAPTTRPFAIAPHGRGYALVARTFSGMRGLLLDEHGQLTGTLDLHQISADQPEGVSLSASATATVATWNDRYSIGDELVTGRDIYSDVLDADPDQQLISPAAPRQWGLRLASAGNGFLAAWIEWRTRAELGIGRVSAAGVPLDGEGTVVALDVQHEPALTFDGANYLLAWIDGCSVAIVRIAPSGAVLDDPRLARDGCADAVGLGSDGHESLLAVSARVDPEDQYSKPVLDVTRVRQDGTVDPVRRVIPSDDLRALDLSIGRNGDTWLVAWTRYYDDSDCPGICDPPPPPTYSIDAMRLTADLALIDDVPLELTTGGDDRAPSVGANGNDFLVAWERGSDYVIGRELFSARIPLRGAPAAIESLGSGGGPSVAVQGTDYLIAFDDGPLYLLDYQRRSRTPFAIHDGDRQHGVRLVSTGPALAAAYLREASEPQYNFVDRAFLRLLGTLRRGRAVRK
jgi:hypothetical protein